MKKQFTTVMEAKAEYSRALQDPTVSLDYVKELKQAILEMETQCRLFSKIIHSI